MLGGDPAVVAFIRTVEPRHIAVIVGLILECQMAGRIEPGNPVETLVFIGGSTILPLMIGTLAQGNRHLPTPFRALLNEGTFFTEAALQRRIDLALRGVAIFQPKAA